MRVVFMGTPDFAVGTLEAIIKAGHEVVLVVTQPDKPKGRKGELTPPPVKECALQYGLPVFQPDRIRKPENLETFLKTECDMIVVAAFGQILPKEILEHPKYCCINVHASLLPKYRGAAPIQWAIINGDEQTGVTIQKMALGIDTGDIISKAVVEIAEDETGGSLFDKLADVGAQLCVKTMADIEAGIASYEPQDESMATHVGMISKEFGIIDFTKPAKEIECLIRGLNPWPSAYTKLKGKTFKIWKASVVPGKSDCAPGIVLRVGKNEMVVQTGKDALSLQEVQIEGKKRMDIGSFLRGFEVQEGEQL